VGIYDDVVVGERDDVSGCLSEGAVVAGPESAPPFAEVADPGLTGHFLHQALRLV
jgi:hypothetical protein